MLTRSLCVDLPCAYRICERNSVLHSCTAPCWQAGQRPSRCLRVRCRHRPRRARVLALNGLHLGHHACPLAHHDRLQLLCQQQSGRLQAQRQRAGVQTRAEGRHYLQVQVLPPPLPLLPPLLPRLLRPPVRSTQSAAGTFWRHPWRQKCPLLPVLLLSAQASPAAAPAAPGCQLRHQGRLLLGACGR